MTRTSLIRCLVVVAGIMLAGATLVASIGVLPAAAHGSTQEPASRTYACRFESPNNPMCATAWAANSQALYDWMEVNIGDANGRHRELIPDGQLCGAGRAKYAAFNQPGAWPLNELRTDGSGFVDLVYENTAPHSTAYYRVYITRPGFDARTDALGWNDLELAFDSGPLDRAPSNRFRVPLPTRNEPAILYIVWQRSDSPEAFYACSDVTVIGSGASPAPTAPTPTTTPSTSAPTTGPPTTSPRTTPSATAAPDTAAPSPAPTVSPSTAAPATTATDSTTTTPPADEPAVAPPPNDAPSPPTTALAPSTSDSGTEPSVSEPATSRASASIGSTTDTEAAVRIGENADLGGGSGQLLAAPADVQRAVAAAEFDPGGAPDDRRLALFGAVGVISSGLLLLGTRLWASGRDTWSGTVARMLADGA